MFSYLKYFAIVSLVLVLITAIGAGIYCRSVLSNDVIRGLGEQSNVSFGKGFANSLAIKYFGENHLLDLNIDANNPNYQIFSQEVQKYVDSLPLAKFTLLTPQKKKLIEIVKEKIAGEESPEGQSDLDTSLHGKTTSAVIGDAWSGNSKAGLFVRSFVPIGFTANHVDLVAELVYRVSPSWREPLKSQIIATGIIFAIFILLYAALFVTISRAEKIITAQHEANLELTEAKVRAEAENQEKSKFLANISHELRTPLNAIIGFSEIIKDEVMGPLNNDQYKDYINDIYASGVHLLSLINDILDFSKAEAGKLEVELVEVDVTKIMKACMRLISPRAEEANVNIIDEVPSDHFVVKTDPKRLKQILLNLLSNSVKFTPSGGRITLHSWYNVTEDILVIEVKDTGIGIAPKDLSKVMSTFGQVENEYNRKYDGTGLGLPLSKKLIELMGGKFKIESQVGVGTSITLTLPKEGRVNAPKA